MTFKTFAVSAFLGASAVLAATVGANAATTFDFSYQLVDGSGNDAGLVTGSFTGDASGNDVTNIANVTAFFNNAALNSPLYVYHYVGPANQGNAVNYVAGGAIASFDGADNNFVFADSAPDANNNIGAGFTNYFYVIQPWYNPGPGSGTIATQYYNSGNYIEQYNGLYDPNNWSLTAVPEPATWAMMLVGFGGIGFGLRRARKLAVATA